MWPVGAVRDYENRAIPVSSGLTPRGSIPGMIRFHRVFAIRATRVAAVLLAAAACALLACQRRSDAPPPTPPMFRGDLVGQPLPELDIREWVIDPDPEIRRSREHPLIIVFWNTGDATSDEALTLVQTIAVELNHRGLHAITVHTDIGFDEKPDRSRIREYLDAAGIILATAIDRGNATMTKCGLYDVPCLIYADEKGIVRGMTKNYRVSKNAEIAAFVRSALLGIATDPEAAATE